MEFRDLRTQYLRHRREIDTAIQNVMLSSQFIGGDPVRQLEEQLAEYTGVSHCVTCANGTDALQLALMAWGIGKGDAVFVPDFTFFSTAEVVPWVGATPVFVDVEKSTFNIAAKSLEEAVQLVLNEGRLTPKVVVAVDLFGQPAEFAAIRKIADQYGLMILEDGAQGFGGEIDGSRACSFGDMATTSFFPAKPLGCYGDGGAVFTDNDAWAEMIRSYKVHGKGKDKYDNVRIGLNSRLDTIQAAVLIEKLKFFDQEILESKRIAEEYTGVLREVVETPVIMPHMSSSWAQYTVCFENEIQRKQVMSWLKNHDIPTAVYYMRPMHLQKAFEGIELPETNCIISEKICQTCLSLPMHAYLKADEVKRVCELLKQGMEKG